MHSDLILQKMNNKFPDFQTFENEILKNIEENYFPLIGHSLYRQLNYLDSKNRKLTTVQFKNLLNKNKFVALINDVYRTRVSTEGLQIINNKLNDIENFDDYNLVLSLFEGCNPRKLKNGELIKINALVLVLNYYTFITLTKTLF